MRAKIVATIEKYPDCKRILQNLKDNKEVRLGDALKNVAAVDQLLKEGILRICSKGDRDVLEPDSPFINYVITQVIDL